MQAVILAGGLGTRLRPLTVSVPKAMVPVGGRPFLEHQLNLLSRSGVRDVVLCVGHLGETIQAQFGDGRKYGLAIRYALERTRLLGTAGAVKNAEALLDDVFFVINGDTYPMLDFPSIMERFLNHDALGLMVVYRNEDRWDRSNVVLDGPFVHIYDKHRRHPGMVHIDFGVSVFRKAAFQDVQPGIVVDLLSVYQALIARRQLLAYETGDRFYEVGSPEGLREFDALVRAGVLGATTHTGHAS